MSGRSRGPDLYLRGKVYYCWFYDHHGEQIRRSTRQTDRAVAKKAARKIEKEFWEQADKPAAVTLETALSRYLAKTERAERSEQTLDYYFKKAKPLLRGLGRDTDINTLRMSHIEAYMDFRREEILERKPNSSRSIATIGKELGLLRSALNYLRKQRGADNKRLYRGDPTELFPEGVIGNYKPVERALSHAEYVLLYNALAPERREYLQAFCGLGVRDSELYGITPKDMDLPERRLRIPGTKTKGSERWMPAPAEVWDVLVRRASKTENGQPLFPRWGNVRRDLHNACAKAGIEHVSPNDLRRTFATWQAEAGVPESVTASLLGHANSSMLRRVYTQIGTEAKRAAMAKLPALIPPPAIAADCDVVCDKRTITAAVPAAPAETTPIPRNDENPANSEVFVVPRPGIEPGTRGFSIPCSTN